MNLLKCFLSFCFVVAAVCCWCAGVRAADTDEELLKGFEQGSMQFTGGEYKDETFHYRLLRPASIKPEKKFPLILFLHGAGERGTDNRLQLKYLPESMATRERQERYPCFLLAPQCRPNRRWVEVHWADGESTPMTEQPSPQLQMVIELIQKVLKAEPIAPDRIYLTGLSMGGYGTWELVCRHPDWFAAVAPICGGGDESAAGRLVDVPIWAFHGGADNVVPPIRSRRMVQAVREAGGNAKYTEYPGVGHNSWSRAYSDESGLLDWIFKHRKK